MRTAVFIGHNDCYGLSKEELTKMIIKCIENGVCRFLSGGQGGFDRMAASAVYKLKETYPYIKNILVIPYLSFKIFEKNYFDEIIYPDGFEKYSYKAAIPERNKYMVNISDAAICFVSHSWGGAAKTYEYAVKKKLEINNLAHYC